MGASVTPFESERTAVRTSYRFQASWFAIILSILGKLLFSYVSFIVEVHALIFRPYHYNILISDTVFFYEKL